MAKRPELQIVVIFDDRPHPVFRERLAALQTSNLLQTVELQPKLLSLSQATEFAMSGKPFRNVGSEGTLFEGLSEAEARQIIEAFAERYPLHFRLIEVLRWSGSSYDLDNERPISFEERLAMVREGKFDKQLNEKLSTDPMGIKRKATLL